LLWGDVCGLVWGKRNEPIEVEVSNKRLRQTYYGAVNLKTHQFHLKEYDAGNATNTVDYVKFLQTLYPKSKIWLIWDGASYHRFSEMRDYLVEVNVGLDEKDWRVNCILFAPNAPEQNPVEDIWLKGKNWLRKHFAQNRTFAQVKQCFSAYLKDKFFDLDKFSWYMPNPQMI
jgi:transposase